MKKLLVILALFSTSFCFAQNLQNAHWRFPVNSGADFTTTSPPTPASSAINYTNYGGSAMPASVSDVNGNLLFYTDGINVWDNNNQQFATGLYGYSTNVRTAQKVVIVPKPGNANRYYIFTLGSINQSGVDPNGIGRGGIHYTVVDFVSGTWQINPAFINTSLKNVAGDLIDYPFDLAHTEDNAVFITGESRMTTTLNRTGDKVWVSIIADFYSNHRHTKKFLNYLVSANGISAQPDGVSTGPAVETSVVNPSYDNLEYSESSMKISPNGAFLCDGEDVADLFNYDNLNGTISFNKRIFDGTG